MTINGSILERCNSSVIGQWQEEREAAKKRKEAKEALRRGRVTSWRVTEPFPAQRTPIETKKDVPPIPNLGQANRVLGKNPERILLDKEKDDL